MALETDWTFGGTFPFEPRWFTTGDGVQIHYVDEGPRDGEPIVMLHGNPTWSYLYRRFVSAFADAGYRAVAHDQMGFGRSEKPPRESEYRIDRQARHFGELMDHLRLDGITLIFSDFGGPVGLGWAVDHPERIRRLVVFNSYTGWIPPGQKMPGVFKLIRGRTTGPLIVKRLHFYVRGMLFKKGIMHMDRIGPNERAAYFAPHPSAADRAGLLEYARLIPWDDGNPTLELGQHVEDTIDGLLDKDALICWPMKDIAFPDEALQQWRDRFPNAEVHEIPDAGHFVQEDAHERLIPWILDFLRRTPPH